MKRHVPTCNTTKDIAVVDLDRRLGAQRRNPGASRTWEVEDIEVAVVTQNRAVPVVGQTRDVLVGFEWALHQGDSSLKEDLDEDGSCEDGEHGAAAAVRKAVGLLYLGLKTVAYGGELLITGVNTFKSQQRKTYFLAIAGGVNSFSYFSCASICEIQKNQRRRPNLTDQKRDKKKGKLMYSNQRAKGV